MVGSIVGAGIFLNPAVVAQRAGTAGAALAAWAAGGAIALVGALVFGSLGSLRPRAGGGYAHLREAFGSLPAFLYGWTFLVVINAGGVAAVATTFASYTADLLGLDSTPVRPLAVAAVLALTGLNVFGIRLSSGVQGALVASKLLFIAGLAGVGLLLAGAPPLDSTAAVTPARAGPTAGLGAALVPVLFAYGGWQQLNHVAGEVRQPRRTLPRAVVLGVLAVTASYLLVNVACLRVLGVEGLAGSTAPAADVLRAVWGPRGASVVAAGIALSTFAFVHVALLGGARVYQAMAADGLFFSSAARLHPRWRTPVLALVIQGTWTAILAASGTYGELLDYTVFGDWILFGLVGSTLLVLHGRPEPGAARPFRLPLHPLLPLAFAAASLYVVYSSIAANPRNAAIGALLIGLGIPIHSLWTRRLLRLR